MPLHVANLITQNGCLTNFSQEPITFSILPCPFAASDFCVFFSPTSKLWLPSCPGTLWQNKPTNMLMNNSNFSPVMYENRDAKETLVASVGSTLRAVDWTSLVPPARFPATLIFTWRGKKLLILCWRWWKWWSQIIQLFLPQGLSTDVVKNGGMLQHWWFHIFNLCIWCHEMMNERDVVTDVNSVHILNKLDWL